LLLGHRGEQEFEVVERDLRVFCGRRFGLLGGGSCRGGGCVVGPRRQSAAESNEKPGDRRKPDQPLLSLEHSGTPAPNNSFGSVFPFPSANSSFGRATDLELI